MPAKAAVASMPRAMASPMLRLKTTFQTMMTTMNVTRATNAMGMGKSSSNSQPIRAFVRHIAAKRARMGMLACPEPRPWSCGPLRSDHPRVLVEIDL